MPPDPPPILRCITVGAGVGSLATWLFLAVLFVVGGGGDPYTRDALLGPKFPEAYLVLLIGWWLGLAIFAAPFWLALHRRGYHSWWLFGVLGGVITFVVTFALFGPVAAAGNAISGVIVALTMRWMAYGRRRRLPDIAAEFD
jgi:hypothetical protein